MKLSYLLVSVALLFFCCKPTSYTLDNYTGKKLSIASGGGFTGQVIEFTIFENGQVFKNNSLTNTTEEKKRLKKNNVSQLFKNYFFLGLDRTMLNKPGNMYYYIKMEEGERVNKILWNEDKKLDVDNNIRVYYQTIMQSLQSN